MRFRAEIGKEYLIDTNFYFHKSLIIEFTFKDILEENNSTFFPNLHRKIVIKWLKDNNIPKIIS
jgi:hypothetical protein